MYINGIGRIAKEDAMSILTEEGRKAVLSGEITTQELGNMYKYRQIEKASKIGSCGDTFRRNFERIPSSILEKCTPSEIAELVDAFYKCYGDGKNT